MNRAISLILFLAVYAAVLLSGGCKHSEVTGGTAQHEDGGFELTYHAPGGGTVTVKDQREYIATTQPSYNGNQDASTFKLGKATEGMISGASLEAENFKTNPTKWGLVLMFLVVAGLFYSVKKITGVVLCVAGAILTVLAPTALAIGVAVFAIGYLGYVNRATLSRLAKGTEQAIEELPAPAVETLKTKLSMALNDRDKKVIRSIKPTV